MALKVTLLGHHFVSLSYILYFALYLIPYIYGIYNYILLFPALLVIIIIIIIIIIILKNKNKTSRKETYYKLGLFFTAGAKTNDIIE